jgi:hypothetical protein
MCGRARGLRLAPFGDRLVESSMHVAKRRRPHVREREQHSRDRLRRRLRLLATTARARCDGVQVVPIDAGGAVVEIPPG